MPTPVAPPCYNEIPISVEGYRFEDLQARGVVNDRSDAHRKQRKHHFPTPIKLGDRYAWWPASWIEAWLKWRASLGMEG